MKMFIEPNDLSDSCLGTVQAMRRKASERYRIAFTEAWTEAAFLEVYGNAFCYLFKVKVGVGCEHSTLGVVFSEGCCLPRQFKRIQ